MEILRNIFYYGFTALCYMSVSFLFVLYGIGMIILFIEILRSNKND